MFQLVNLYGEPINDETFSTNAEAEREARKQWALGWKVYVAPVKTERN